MCREKERGDRETVRATDREGRRRRGSCSVLPRGPDCPSWLPIKNRIPPQTVCVFSLTPPGCHSTRQSHHACPLPLSVSLSPLSWLTFLSFFCSETCLLSTCGACPWQVKRILHHRSWVAASAMHPLFPLFSCFLPHPASHLSLSLSQYWVAGVKGGQRNLITVTVGLFWHCSWSCADTHRAVCWL